ncbi:hypothetical protein BC835DRAFT_1308810 [Cytidiella melzeri]|nr:hypothetical protein BC835DRAFT_1308810 [Cytidiella melzeri]
MSEAPLESRLAWNKVKPVIQGDLELHAVHKQVILLAESFVALKDGLNGNNNMSNNIVNFACTVEMCITQACMATSVQELSFACRKLVNSVELLWQQHTEHICMQSTSYIPLALPETVNICGLPVQQSLACYKQTTFNDYFTLTQPLPHIQRRSIYPQAQHFEIQVSGLGRVVRAVWIS